METFIELIPEIAALITSCGTVVITVKIFFTKEVNKRMNDLELSCIKTDLTNFITDMENGMTKSEIQKLNACEIYKRYTELGGNSYIHSHFEQLQKEGKI